MVTHPGFGITTQEIDQHQEEIQVNHFQSSISQFIQKKSQMSLKEYSSVVTYAAVVKLIY